MWGGEAQYCHGNSEVGGRGEGHIAASYTLEWAHYVLSRAFGGGGGILLPRSFWKKGTLMPSGGVFKGHIAANSRS